MNYGTVVKLGGSLLTLPDLTVRLVDVLRQVESPVLVVGGGAAADVVRRFADQHGIDDPISHELAIEAMDFNTKLLAATDARFHIVTDVSSCSADGFESIPLFMPSRILQRLEATADEQARLARSWNVTSDSIAAWIAEQLAIPHVLLLKSVDPAPRDGTRHEILKTLSCAGIVDHHFPAACDTAERLSWSNLRAETTIVTRVW